MNLAQIEKIKLENDSASIIIDPSGGAISSFLLKGKEINPLSFSFSKEQMPSNNKAGANYQGHFLCLGRWGEPSAGEIKAGLPNHGEPANIEWTIKERSNNRLQINTIATKEGLKVSRILLMDEHNPVYAVKEMITNINPLGRLYNIVQHPTLAAPFLDQSTIIDCNAATGFDQAFYKDISSNIIKWPTAKDDCNNTLDLRNSGTFYNAVYSFIVNPEDDYGWITAFSPTHHILFGYFWKRSHYPWIHLWQHYVENKIQYRGIEFGTAGIHQPFEEILNVATSLFGEKTYAYIDAGETITKRFFSFILSVEDGFIGVQRIYFSKNKLVLKALEGESDIIIKPSQNIVNELSE